MALYLPIQAAVDRSTPLEIYLVEQPITVDGNVVEILANPVGGPYGPLPGDPAWFARRLDPRVAAGQLAARYAASRYWFGSTADRVCYSAYAGRARGRR
jgi:hypothetical protein